MKHLEGKEVYLLPTGNNTRRKEPNRYLKGKIKKVARVFVTLDIGYEQKHRISSYNKMHIDNGNNGGYLVFEGEQEIRNYLDVKRISNLIFEKYRYSQSYEKLDIDILKQVAVLLGIDIGEVSE